MNIIEAVRGILTDYPGIGRVLTDYTERDDDFGLSPIGDTLLRETVTGTEIRQHGFLLYIRLSSVTDFERLSNSGMLLDLQSYLESAADGQPIDGGYLRRITCGNGMLYDAPQGELTEGVLYQLQINAEYQKED